MKLKHVLLTAFLAFAVGVTGLVPSNAEVIRKRHTSVQKILTDVDLNDYTDATTGVSQTVDLDGGNYDKCSFMVYTTSGTGGTAVFAAEISPDGGTTWIDASESIVTVSTHTTSYEKHIPNIKMSPGLKVRLTTTISSGATYYGITAWAMPSVD